MRLATGAITACFLNNSMRRLNHCKMEMAISDAASCISKKEREKQTERESAVNRESERKKGRKYAEHIWAANLSALLNNFGPLVDWLTGLLAGWPEGQMDRGTAGQRDSWTGGQTSDCLF